MDKRVVQLHDEHSPKRFVSQKLRATCAASPDRYYSEDSMLLLAFYLLLAIGVSFLCSILEAVFLSITPSYVAARKEQHPRVARILESLQANVDRPLAAILTLNTIAHTVGAAGVGAQAERIWGSTSLGIVSALVTLAILVFSEIIPKTLGATYWRALAPTATFVIQWLIWGTLPFVWMAQAITAWIAPGHTGPRLHRDELSAMAEAGRLEGVFSEDEARVVHNLVSSWRRPVSEILTPRTVVTALQCDLTAEATMSVIEQRPFSRLPAFDQTIDQIQGFVLKDELVKAVADGQSDRRVREFLRPILIVPATVSVSNLYRRMLRQREHIAAAVDEYGGLAGIVTMEDVVETLLGEEIVDEVDEVVDMRAWAREQSQKQDSSASSD